MLSLDLAFIQKGRKSLTDQGLQEIQANSSTQEEFIAPIGENKHANYIN